MNILRIGCICGGAFVLAALIFFGKKYLAKLQSDPAEGFTPIEELPGCLETLEKDAADYGPKSIIETPSEFERLLGQVSQPCELAIIYCLRGEYQVELNKAENGGVGGVATNKVPIGWTLDIVDLENGQAALKLIADALSGVKDDPEHPEPWIEGIWEADYRGEDGPRYFRLKHDISKHADGKIISFCFIIYVYVSDPKGSD